MKAGSLFLLALLIVVFVLGVVIVVRQKSVETLEPEPGPAAASPQSGSSNAGVPVPPTPGKGADKPPVLPPVAPPGPAPATVDEPGEPFFKDGLHHPLVGLLPAGARAVAPVEVQPYNPEKSVGAIQARHEAVEKERLRQKEEFREETEIVRKNVPDLNDDQAAKLYDLYKWYFDEFARRLRLYHQKGVTKPDAELHREVRSELAVKARAFLDPGQQEAFRVWIEKITSKGG